MTKPRVHVNVRIKQEQIDRADALAAEHGLRRAEILRIALAAGMSSPTILVPLIERAKSNP